jgi:hypothetical protein
MFSQKYVHVHTYFCVHEYKIKALKILDLQFQWIV